MNHHEKAVISFSGCGTANYYQAGVLYGLQQSGMQFKKALGASAGAFIALGALLDIDGRELADNQIQLSKTLREKHRVLRPHLIDDAFQSFASQFIAPESYKQLSGKLVISITQLFPFCNKRVSIFESNAALKEALRSSCFIPSPRKAAMRFRGKSCIDGGVTSNLLFYNSASIYVSPFPLMIRDLHESHICPKRRFPIINPTRLYSERAAWKLFDQGKEDALQFVETNHFEKLVS